MNPELILIAIFLVFGLLVGSFLNAVIYRVPRGINIAVPRSHCTSCKKTISWYENIPVVSYIFLRGKCSNCKTSYSILYPSVELFVGMVSVILAPTVLSSYNLMLYFFYFSVFCALLCHFVIDIQHKILPNSINIYLASLFLVHSLYFRSLEYIGFGLLVGFAFPYFVTYVFYKLKGEVGLGGGDIKLYAALGIILGPVNIINNIFLSCFFGAIFSLFMMSIGKMSRKSRLAFGPFIIIVAVFQIFFPSAFKSFSSIWSI
ncbi:A24 family peptidase [Halobacteriovorax sp. HLS]|uniref:prepilin peptidase n=1 Tax=Halobacteriovorax sp. HLS TaxID=2234000 RepID=UPI000FD7BA9E|nr:A24 family peptidase [Halobacteriovorax sp. HLS]